MSSSSQTMQQIADALGLNRVTVSLVINGHAERRGVAAKTVERVNACLRETGYVPSREAVALRTGQRCGLGILHCGHLYSHVAQAFNLMVQACVSVSSGVEVVVRPPDGLLDGMRELVSRGVERAVWIQSVGTQIPPSMRGEVLALGRRLSPIVYNYRFDLDEDAEELIANGFSLIGLSRRSGYCQMARFVKSLGHRRVVLADACTSGGLPRIDSQLVEAMRSYGLDVIVPDWKPPSATNLVERGAQLARCLLRLRRREEFGMVCFRDDEVAGGAISVLMQNGVLVPGDLGVVSMDGHPLGDLFRVPLTTLAVPVVEMVRKTLLLCAPSSVNSGPLSIRFRYRLIRRSSHAET